MAVTKIYAIRSRLDRRINYAINGEKTEQCTFAGAINCADVKTAFHEMRTTKLNFHKTGDVLGYHLIQSFAPGEVTAQQAHEIGLALAQRLFGGRFEAVVGTHLDRAHLHNHIMVNSVSFVDGGKYHSDPKSYYDTVRRVSDELCREHGLTVIEPRGHGKHYAQWKAEQTGKPTMRSLIRTDIDRVIGASYTFAAFLEKLRKMGYVVDDNPNHKYVTVRATGGQRSIRLESLGEGYTEAAIRLRIQRQRTGQIEEVQHRPVKRYRIRGHRGVRHKITGFEALYLRYLYLLRRGKYRSKKHISTIARKEALRLERYGRAFLYLHRQQIATDADLARRQETLKANIQSLTAARQVLYSQRRKEPGSDTAAELQHLADTLRQYRRELRLCDQICEDLPKIRAETEEIRKERCKNEYQRRDR